jgi:hypothetical protein
VSGTGAAPSQWEAKSFRLRPPPGSRLGIGIGVDEVAGDQLASIMAHFHDAKLYTTRVCAVAPEVAAVYPVAVGDVVTGINGGDVASLDMSAVLTQLKAVSERLKAGLDTSLTLDVLRLRGSGGGGAGGSSTRHGGRRG